MAAKTSFSKEDFTGLLAGYDLGEYQDHKPFEHGADQTNIQVITTKGTYAFRYYEKRSVDYVLFEIDLLHYLVKHSYSCAESIKNKQGDYSGMYNQKPFAFFTFLEGTHTDNAGNFKDAARAISKLHTITEGYKPNHAGMFS